MVLPKVDLVSMIQPLDLRSY